MAEVILTQEALAHLGLEARVAPTLGEAGIGLTAMPANTQVSLRGEGDDLAFRQAAESVLGFALPVEPNTTTRGDGGMAFWLGPSEWLLCLSGLAETWIDRLSAALAGVHHALNDVSESRAAVRVSGPRVLDLLAKGTSLNLHPNVFPPGACAQSTLALTDVLLHRLADEPEPVFDLHVHRSFADYLWRWLEAAAAEFGAVVLASSAAD